MVGDCYVPTMRGIHSACESIVPDAEIDRVMQASGAAAAGVETSHSHVLLSLDGFKAWEIAKEIFGADVLDCRICH